MRSSIVVNTRNLTSQMSGVQRYTHEILARLPGIRTIGAHQARTGLSGHLWEQAFLPCQVGPRLLWSPGNTGPIAVRHQVLTVHDIAPIDHPEWFSPRFASWYNWLWPRLLPRVAHILTAAGYTRDRLCDRFDLHPERISVVPLGVDRRFRPQSEERIAAVRTRYGIGDRPYLLCLGSLEPRKNLPRLLAAWEQLAPSDRDDCQLVLAGGDNPTIFATGGIERPPPHTILTGRIRDEDLPALYSGARVFIYPSIYEGFGLPPLEAMACDTPVIVGNRTALPETVGDAAVLVDPGDSGQLSSAMTQVINASDRHHYLGPRGHARTRTLTWERCAQSTAAILSACANKDYRRSSP